MRRYPGIAGQIAWAIHRPRAALELVRDRPLWLGMTVLTGLPGPVRSLIARPVVRVAGMADRRPGDHPVAGPFHLVALVAQGRPDDAARVAERLGPTASARTAARLARVAVAIEDPGLADRLIAPHRDALATDPGTDGLRAEIALRMGRYREAVAIAASAATGRTRDPAIHRTASRAQAELDLMDPAWRPDLPTAAEPVQGRPGRILHLLTNSLPHRHAGYTVRAQQVARSQQAVGLEPRMVTRAGFPGNEGVVGASALDEEDGVTYQRIRPDLEPSQPVDRVAQATAAGLFEIATTLRPALLQPTSNYVNAQVALAVGERLGLPVVYEVRGFLEETWLSHVGVGAASADRYVGARAIETACMQRAQAIVTLSETMRTDILGRGGIAPDDVVVIPNAVDVDRFVPGPRDDALAATLGIARDETVIGYISSFTPYEGIGFLIEAVVELRRRGRRVRLLLVGDGDVRSDLESLAGRTGLLADGTAIFTGRVPHADVRRYYRTIDCFVVPRTDDRVSRLVTPLKPYEAMAMERALVVSGVPALLEIVRDGETGLSFPPEDAMALADVLDALIDDPEQRQRLGTAARAWVAEHRTWAQNGQRYLALYQRLGVA